MSITSIPFPSTQVEDTDGQAPVAAAAAAGEEDGAAVAASDPVHSIWTIEGRVSRLVWALTALAVAGLFFWCVFGYYWAPANGGVDQNGYLVGGKQFARTLSMGLTPEDPWGFVGRMWIGTPHQTYYPKYPLGLPFIYAVMLWIGGSVQGPALAYMVNPVCMSLAVLGTFCLLRQVVPGFYAVLGAILLGSSPVTLYLATNPNSHASTLACVVWGMVLLLRWWRCGGLWTARGAGWLLGYAATIRYTEGLLILPLALVAIFACFSRRGGDDAEAADDTAASQRYGRRRQALLMMAWWALPILILVTFNLFWFGDITGYDSTNESTGFRWEYFRDNWETTIRLLNNTALFFILPLGVVGLAVMLRWQWRLATVLLSWIVPGVLLYTAYYWAPDNDGVSFMRFFLTFLPGLILAAMWLLHTLVPVIGGWVHDAPLYVHTLKPPRRGSVAVPIIVGAMVLIASSVQVFNAQPQMEADFRRQLSLDEGAHNLLAVAPQGSVLFASDQVLHHLQFISDYRFYSSHAFRRSSLRRLQDMDPNEPQGLQPQRAQFLLELVGDRSDAELAALQIGIIQRALGQGQRVFYVGNRGTLTAWERRLRSREQLSDEEKQSRLLETILRRTSAGKNLTAHIVDRWADAPMALPDTDSRTRGARWQRAQRWRQPDEWVVIEIERQPE